MASIGNVVLVGAGNMGGALLSGWLANGIAGPSVTVIDPSPSEAMQEMISKAGATHHQSLPEGSLPISCFWRSSRS